MPKKAPSSVDVDTLGSPAGKRGLKEGQARVVNPDVARLQAIALARETVMNGNDIDAAARKFNMSTATAKKRLSDHTRAGLFVQHEDTLLVGIVPMAEQVIQRFLQPQMMRNKNGDPILDAGGDHIYEVTKEQATLAAKVYDGVGLFRKPGTQAPATMSSGKKGATLEDHIARLRQEAEALEEAERRTQLAEESVDADFTITGPAGDAIGAAVAGQLRLPPAPAGLDAGSHAPPEDANHPAGPAPADERPAEAPGEAICSGDQETGHGDPEQQPDLSPEPPQGPPGAR